jgi:hypothetical protein
MNILQDPLIKELKPSALGALRMIIQRRGFVHGGLLFEIFSFLVQK